MHTALFWNNMQDAGEGGEATEKRILWIDDDACFLWSLHSALIGKGFSLDLAASIETAERRLSNRTYDLIICDQNLADEETGLEFVERLRSRRVASRAASRNQRTRVMLFSIAVPPDAEARIDRLDDVLSQPKAMCDVQSFLALVDEALE